MADQTKPIVVDYVVTVCRAHHHIKLSWLTALANRIADISREADMARFNCATQLVGDIEADRIPQLLAICAEADCNCSIEFFS